jgi:hypothetical protein
MATTVPPLPHSTEVQQCWPPAVTLTSRSSYRPAPMNYYDHDAGNSRPILVRAGPAAAVAGGCR